MIGLLRLLREHSGPVEADLQRYYHVDYRDRWRGDLSLRRLHVLVSNLPPDSAVALALGGDGFTVTHHLLMDVFHGFTGHQHPAKNAAEASRDDPERQQRIDAAKARAQARRDAGLQQ